MKRMRRKDQFIDVVGVWDGSEDSDLLNWLTANRFVYQIQSEDEEQVGWRTKPRFGKQEPSEGDEVPRKQLVVLGKSMHDETTLAPNVSVLVLGEGGRVRAYDLDIIEDDYEDVPEVGMHTNTSPSF